MGEDYIVSGYGLAVREPGFFAQLKRDGPPVFWDIDSPCNVPIERERLIGGADEQLLDLIRRQLRVLALDRLARRLDGAAGDAAFDELVAAVTARRLDPEGAVDALISAFDALPPAT